MPEYGDPAVLQGLTEAEAARRRAAGQGNTAPPATGRTYRQIILENVFTFINMVLFALGAALAALGRVTDAVVSTTIISVNVLVSVVQEIRAKRTLDKIALLTRPRATVIRDGQARQVLPEELVIGDVLRVEPGDQIVLDGTLVGAGRIQADESALTGESDLVPKIAGDPVFSGSFCMNGSAYYRAEKVGAQSLANQITRGARSFRRVLTPLQQTINGVIRVFLVVVVYLVCLLALNAYLEGRSLADSVENSALVAGLVPNGLFISIAIAYTLAAVRIARLGALVQQANAIESLSHVDVLCLDKTGTLTANRLQFNAVHPLAADEPELRAVLGEMSASARTLNKTSEALKEALPALARKTAADVPFSSARKWSAVAFDTPERRGVYALGALEFLRPSLELDGDQWMAVAGQVHELSDGGLRVLALAWHPDPAELAGQPEDSPCLPGGMILLGLVSLTDELRPEAAETLKAFIQAGVRPKIISGDNPETVAALARQAGLVNARLISGPDLEDLEDAQLMLAADEATIFGRVTPRQKERLVGALKAGGHYVAMIGDGVNDVLSLKQAHLAVAMQSGSQAARSVADVVLLQDSFAALLPAVTEGQRILNGMQDILKLYLTRIATVALLITSSLVVGIFPLGLRQGSALTLFSVGIPTVMLAFWARPGPVGKRGLTAEVYHFIVTPMVLSSVIGLMVFYGVLVTRLQLLGGWGSDLDLLLLRHNPAFDAALEVARSALAVFMVFAGIALVIFVEPPNGWWVGGDVEAGDWRPTRLAAGLAAVFVLIVLTPLRDIFALSRLSWYEAAAIVAALAVWLFTVRYFWRQRVIARVVGAIS